MSQMLSPTTIDVSIGTPSRSAAATNRSGLGFGMLDLVARDDDLPVRIDAKGCEVHGGGRHPAARRDRPIDVVVGKPRQQLLAPGSARTPSPYWL